nr:amino acid adenylation domain-containing protein [uncultured Chitinophaga sp.]
MSTESKIDLATLEANMNVVDRNYWKNRLKKVTYSPYLRHRKDVYSETADARYKEVVCHAPDKLVAEIAQMASNNISKHVLLLAGQFVLLRKYAATDDVVIFTPAYKDVNGPALGEPVFPVRVNDFSGKTFRDFLLALKYSITQDLAHTAIPLPRMLNTEAVNIPGLSTTAMLVESMQQKSSFDELGPEMTFSFSLLPLSLTVRYDSSKFSREDIAVLSAHYFPLLTNLVRNKELPVDDIAMLPGEDKQRIVDELAGNSMSSASSPASYHQERLWFIDNFESGYLYREGPVYHNIPLVLDFKGTFSAGAMESAFTGLLKNQEILRTVITDTGNGLSQQVIAADKFPVKLRCVNESEENTALLINRDINTAFILSESLVRATLFMCGENCCRLLLTVHHIIADRYTMALLAEELVALYDNCLHNREEVIEHGLQLQYRDFTSWQLNAFGKLEPDLLTYWKLELKNKLKPLRLPCDNPRAAIHTYTAASKEVLIPAGVVTGLQQYKASTHIEINVLLMAVFKILLHRYTGQHEITIGTSVVNRFHPALEKTAGPVENLIAVGSTVSDSDSFNEYIATLADIYNRNLQHGMMPFDKLVKELAPDKDMSRTALFDVLFQYGPQFTISRTALQSCDVSVSTPYLGYGKYDMNLSLHPDGDTIRGKLVYNADYYHETTIDGLVRHYGNLLESLLTDPAQQLATAGMMDKEEQAAILAMFDRTGTGYPANKHIISLFEDQVKKWPQHPALTCENESLNYTELDQLSDKLAYALRENGVQQGTIVGLLMNRSTYTVIGILAILKAGAAYLPLDVDYPKERIDYYIQDSGAAFILTTTPYRDMIHADCKIICADSLLKQPGPANKINVNISPADLSYIIYTSGTTGNPKGVMVEHRNVVRLFYNDEFQFHFDETDVWTMFHSHCFDFSVWEIFGALLFGGRLVIIPKMLTRDTAAFLELLQQEKVTVLNQTPAACYNLIREEARLPEASLQLKYIIFGGEALSPVRLSGWKQRYPAVKLVNMFGITETTVHVTYKEIGQYEIDNNISNIGGPIPTTSVYILDNARKPVPRGVIGELYVGGAGVARGYLGNKTLTDSRFVVNPFNPAERLYKSGDQVRMLKAGDLEFLGRIDHQVQVRGFRIELGEIENHLILHHQIDDAVVVVWERKEIKYLAAYYTASEELNVLRLRSFLSEKLPDYMIPDYFTHLEKLPLTQNGKLDREALPEPQSGVGNTTEYTAPRNDLEANLADIWAEILGLDKSQIGINNNFFELGGHSLLAPILLAVITERLKIKSHLRILYRHPTIAAFADHVSQMDSGKPGN